MQALAGPGGYCGTGKMEFNAVRFGYAKNGQTAAFVHDEKWCWNPNWSSCSSDPYISAISKYAITWAREFRYDGARARYLVRTLDAAQFKAGSVVAIDETWTDYDGDETYGDWAMVNGQPSSTASTRGRTGSTQGNRILTFSVVGVGVRLLGPPFRWLKTRMVHGAGTKAA